MRFMRLEVCGAVRADWIGDTHVGAWQVVVLPSVVGLPSGVHGFAGQPHCQMDGKARKTHAS